ncbi:MAG: DUF86 domain-containing protein [Candidatus Binatia bacterium]
MKDDQVFLAHIRDAIARIESYTHGGRGAFLIDTKTQDAVMRNLEVIGEAVKNLSVDLRTKHPEVPWNRIAGMRDVLIHEYFGVRLETVWNAVEHRLPELKRYVAGLLES